MTTKFQVITIPTAEDLQVVQDVDPQTLTVAEAIERFLEMRVAERIIPRHGDSYRHYDVQVRRSLGGALGQLRLADLRPDDVRRWLAGVRSSRTGALVSALTLRHYLKGARVFFNRAVAEGWIERDPSAPIPYPKVQAKPVNILSVERVFAFFKANVGNPAVFRLCLEAFAGVRFTTAAKLTRECVRLDVRGLELPASIHKSGRRHFRQGHPDNLWEWLAEAPEITWDMDWRAYREAKQQMHLAAGLRTQLNRYGCFDPMERLRQMELKNVWRHSFASYLLALDGTYTRAAYLMQHTTAKTTQMHYEGLATHDDARLYFAITPDAVRTMTWEEFRRWVLKPAPTVEPEAQRHVHRAILAAPALPQLAAAATGEPDYRAG